MKKKYALLFILCSLSLTATYAQVIIGGGYGGGYYRGRVHVRGGRRPANNYRKPEPSFAPEVNISIGYGFPNVDAYQFSNYYGLYKGNVTQTGSVTGAIDYRYNRYNSIGVMATYGKVDIPYTDAYNNYQGKINLESWSVMLNIMQYAPLTNSATLYFHEAIGANINNTSYYGNVPTPTPYALAYQLSIGARFKITENASFFGEAGYGKYIIHGGLSFSFQ